MRSLSWLSFALLFAALPAFPACSSGGSSSTAAGSDGGTTTGTQALWIAPTSLTELAGTHFYDHPWPSDLRRAADGSVVMTGFYNPRGIALIDLYVSSSEGLFQGFSPSAAAYLRFTGAIDPSGLPADPPSSLLASSSVRLIDITPGSPEYGKPHLLETFWQEPAGVYWDPDTLAVQPALGYPLLPATQYALVVTNALHAAGGGALTPSSDLSEVLGLSPLESRVEAAHTIYAPAVTELAKLGIPASSIVQLAVFTTNDPTAQLFSVFDDVHANVPAPTVQASTWNLPAALQTSTYDVYEGYYGPSPNYQAGTPPYSTTGGNFVFTGSKPVMQNTFQQEFCLVVPNATKCPMPADGYPIVLYAHGTGGDYESIVLEENSFGSLVASECMAAMGINQIFSGNRPGSPPGGVNNPNYESDEDLLFYNLNNPAAARTNGQQAAVDVVQQARLFVDSHMTVPASVSKTGATLKFDSSKLVFIGHSEGGLNGPLFMAGDGQARGGVLSGAGAMIIIALLEKTSPVPSVAAAVKTILALDTPAEAAELNLFHPVLNMAQQLIDATDPINYARYIIQQPRAGLVPKSILQTEGVFPDGTGDTYAPDQGIEVHAVALGLPRELPGVHTIPEAPWGGFGDVTVPAGGLSGNLGGGQASGVLGQFEPPPGIDGHFVAFDVPAAHAQVGTFCKNLAANPVGNVPPLSQ